MDDYERYRLMIVCGMCRMCGVCAGFIYISEMFEGLSVVC